MNNVYANRKRKKPQKSVKPTPSEGAKSNPSKRHRDRLNGELERLANLLPFPQDVISRLDKLTVLRLCVSYLRAKSFFNVTLKSPNTKDPESNGLTKLGPELPEGELLLQVLNGFILVVTAGGTIFYASSTIQDYLGFHQSDVIHQSVYDLIHTEDRAEFQRQLRWVQKPALTPDAGQLVAEPLPPENPAFLERNFVCRLRCLLDNFSGFIALNFQGRLKLLHGQNQRTEDGRPVPPQPALFTLASPLQPPSILEIRTKNLMFRTKHKLDFTPTDCDAKGKIVLGYTEAELCDRGSGYQFIHAADMLHCAENHLRMMKTGESGMTVFRLLTKHSSWVWVQANARLVYKNGRPDCIIVSEKVLTSEEGEEHLRKRHLELPFCFTTGEAVLYDSPGPAAGGDALDPDSLLGSLMKQDESIYACAPSSSSSSSSFSSSSSSSSSQSKPPPPPPVAPDDAAGPPEDEFDGVGGVFSSCWQEDVLSPPESALSRRESRVVAATGGGGDADAELWGFMRSMGISREDFELFRQDETFLNVDVDGRDDLPDLTDGILSYVHESLRKGPDGAFSHDAFSYGARFGDHAPFPGGRDAERPDQPSADARWRPLVGHAQSADRYQPLDGYQQQRPHAQPPLAQKRTPFATWAERHPPPPQASLSSLGFMSQQLQPLHGGLLSQHVPQQQQLCRSLKRMQVNGNSRPQSQHAAAAGGHEIPPLFRLDQPGRPPQLCGRPQHGHLCLGGSGRDPRLPLESELNALSVTCSSSSSSSDLRSADLCPQDLDELLGSLDPPERAVRGPAQWSVEARSARLPPPPLQHLTYPESGGGGRLGSVQLGHPVAAGGTDQPFLMQFQNLSHGILPVPGSVCLEEGDFGPPGQPKQQGPAETLPYPDVSLRGFL